MTSSAPIILVPGFWLGAWAWDDVVSALRDDGHDVTALTLPGLESADADRSTITLSDHVSAICEAVTSAGTSGRSRRAQRRRRRRLRRERPNP
ncbi:MAG TPA: alpha/beta fold hydrolase [Gaiellaceae bacterium]|nr:alpha/beta fold hydrolase [Gaiellaceae bacterium]